MLKNEAKRARLLHPLQFLSNLFFSFSAFLHTYSISLQSEGRSRLCRRLQLQIRGGRKRGQLTFRRIEKPHFKAATDFKLMFQVTKWPQKEVVSGYVSNWQPQCLLTAPPTLDAYIHAHNYTDTSLTLTCKQSVRPPHPTHRQIFPLLQCWEPQLTECLATIFISGKDRTGRRIIFLLALSSVKTEYLVSVDSI